MDEEYWWAVKGLRLRIADLLESLAPREWDAPSLCAGWRVRDVAGHLAVVPVINVGRMLSVAPRAGFSPQRINTRVAVQEGSRQPEEIVALIRERADLRATSRVLDVRNSLFDLVVHSQDIARPLGREFDVPPDLTRRGLDRVWEMGWPFRARRRLAGLHLVATDTDWEVGDGAEIAGPAMALILLLTGRDDVAAPELVGPGVGQLRQAS
jgi:uncharacterized protein (TIGR03083 family)